jgi:hypothetical protein
MQAHFGSAFKLEFCKVVSLRVGEITRRISECHMGVISSISGSAQVSIKEPLSAINGPIVWVMQETLSLWDCGGRDAHSRSYAPNGRRARRAIHDGNSRYVE